MAATHRQIKEFCPEVESIEAYIERVELYFEANSIDADWRVVAFLSVIGGNEDHDTFQRESQLKASPRKERKDGPSGCKLIENQIVQMMR